MSASRSPHGPHAAALAASLAMGGAPLSRARIAVLACHGRGGSPADMLSLVDRLALPDLAVVAPAAAGRSWWPNSFLAPLAANEPGVSSGLSVIEAVLDDLEASGFGAERVALLGFSQGACLALEAAARLARPFHCVAGLSGGLIGASDTAGAPQPELYGWPDKQFDYPGALPDAPVLIGCHEEDPHIPLRRVRRSGEVFQALGANAEILVIPGAGHGVVAEEVAWLRRQLNV
ncbi:MAG: dienelactone hydrolase family protein [Pseudomonadota bacterium]